VPFTRWAAIDAWNDGPCPTVTSRTARRDGRTLTSAGAASVAKVRHHHYRHATPHAQIGHPGAYGSPGNLTPGYSSTVRHKPTDTTGN